MTDGRRILALDVGERRTGVAATDYTGTICIPLERIDHKGMNELPDLVGDILRERQSEILVIGVPLSADGTAGPQARKVLDLVARLRKKFGEIEIHTVDESHTSDVAHQLLKEAGVKAARRKRYADSLAALTILQRFLGSPH